LLPKNRRVARSAEITRVIKQGLAIRTPNVTAHILVSGHDGVRFGFIAGKRIGNAVTRNDAKRRFRELTKVLITDDVNVLIVWRLNPPCATAPPQELQRDIARVWAKALKLQPESEPA